MCDGKSNRFFRPWNVSESVSDTVNATVSGDRKDRIGSTIIKREEDNNSVSSVSTYDEASAASSSEHEVSAGRCTKRRRQRRRSESSTASSSRSCSVKSEDANGSSSLDLLNNFVLASPRPSKFSASPSTQDSSSVSGSSCSMTANGSPVSSARYSADYLQRIGFSNSFDSLSGSPSIPVEAIALQGSTISTTGQPFYYEFPPLHHLSQGLYASSMEQAVELIHRQDAVAKQMKKLRPKKFRCEHCDVAFSNNGQLKGHIRIHTGERPFKCDADGCGKSFTRNEELTRHKRIHTGLRPHACLVCGKRFGRKDHLKKHTRTHENRDPYRMSAAALGMFALGHALPQGHPFPSYVYPI